MAKNLDVIVYPTVAHDTLAKYMWGIYDKFYAACGSSRIGVIKFIRGQHSNWYYDTLKENGRWPSLRADVWYQIPLGELIMYAYTGSQTAARNLIKRAGC